MSENAPSISAHSEDAILSSLTQLRESAEALLNDPANASLRKTFHTSQRSIADSLANATDIDPSYPAISAVRQLLSALAASGLQDALAEDTALQQQLLAKGASGGASLLAALLLGPAWRCNPLPTISSIPSPWREDLVHWLFAPPLAFQSPGEADAYSRFLLSQMQELLQWADSHPAEAPHALDNFRTSFSALPLFVSHDDLRAHMELRGKLLAKALPATTPWQESKKDPSANRRLRIGFLARSWSANGDGPALLPSFEHLDSSRFEVVLFAQRTDWSEFEQFCQRDGRFLQTLPDSLPAALTLLRMQRLDVLVFGSDLSAVCDSFTEIAIHRCATLQISTSASCASAGLPGIDLRLSGRLTENPSAAAHLTERLALLPGPAHAFHFLEDPSVPGNPLSRSQLSLPEGAPVFASTASYFKITPELLRIWASLLASIPTAHLLLHPFPDGTTDSTIKRFCCELDATFVAHGIDQGRVVVSTGQGLSRSDLRELLRTSTVYLDASPFSSASHVLAALEVGIPVVAWEGTAFRSRMSAGILRALGLGELVATDEASYLQLASNLALDPARRSSTVDQLALAMDSMPNFLDPLAASDAFGALVELALEEIAQKGHETFRSSREPLALPDIDTAATLAAASALLAENQPAEAARRIRSLLGRHPSLPAARHLMGRALLAQHSPARAQLYLLDAIQHDGQNPQLWHDLACAFRINGLHNESVQAAQTCLRLDERNLDGWLLIAEISRSSGHASLLEDSIQMAHQLAPTDPRVIALMSRTPL